MVVCLPALYNTPPTHSLLHIPPHIQPVTQTYTHLSYLHIHTTHTYTQLPQ